MNNFLILKKNSAIQMILLFSLINASMFIAFDPQGFSLLRIVITSLMLFSVFLLFSVVWISSNSQLPIYFKFILSLLMIWVLFMTLNSFPKNIKMLVTFFGNFIALWTWITPLAIFLGLNILNWFIVFKWLGKVLLFGIFLSIVVFIDLFNQGIGFGVILWIKLFPILLLTLGFQSKYNKYIVYLAIIAFIAVSIVISQRVNILFLFLAFFFFVIEYLKNKKISYLKKAMVLVFVVLFATLLIALSSKFFAVYSKNEELNTDTRTFLFMEFFDDLKGMERVVGRGVLGEYYSPYFEEFTNDSQNFEGDSSWAMRISIEVGYLEMILKGGYILLVLNLMFLIPASYLGIFKSKNRIAKMCGYFILIYLVMWSISYWPVYSAEFLLVWIAAGTAISSKSRNYKDVELRILQKKLIDGIRI